MRKKKRASKVGKRIMVLLTVLLIGGASRILWQITREKPFDMLNATSFLTNGVNKEWDEGSDVALPKINSEKGILINLSSGEVLSEKNPRKKIYPASLTKIMTIYVALVELEDLDEVVEVPSEGYSQLIEAGASMAGFFENEEVPVRDLLYGAMLPSGAEASLALGTHIAGNDKEFVKRMNKMASQLAMASTHFENSTGLHNKNHYTTVEDLSKLLVKALDNSEFRKIFTTKERHYLSPQHPDGLFLTSRLFQYFDPSRMVTGEILGGKTGYTKQAGQCLASLASIGGSEYLLITAGAYGNPDTENKHIDDAISVYNSL